MVYHADHAASDLRSHSTRAYSWPHLPRRSADGRRADTLTEHLTAHTVGPFGSRARFALAAAAADDRAALKAPRHLRVHQGGHGVPGRRRAAHCQRPRRLRLPRGAGDPRGHRAGTGYVLAGRHVHEKQVRGPAWAASSVTRRCPPWCRWATPATTVTERIRERQAGSRRLPALFPLLRGALRRAARARRRRFFCRGARRRACGAVGLQQAAVAHRAARRRLALLPGAHQRVRQGQSRLCAAAPRRLATGRPGHRHVPLRAGRPRARLAGKWVLDEPDIGSLAQGVEYTATWQTTRA